MKSKRQRESSACAPRSHTDALAALCSAAADALRQLHARRDALQRRAEGLLKCKTEFQELARCL